MKFYRKIEFFIFYFFLENLLLKIELSEITPFFYNNFFGFVEGGISPLSPWLRHYLQEGKKVGAGKRIRGKVIAGQPLPVEKRATLLVKHSSLSMTSRAFRSSGAAACSIQTSPTFSHLRYLHVLCLGSITSNYSGREAY